MSARPGETLHEASSQRIRVEHDDGDCRSGAVRRYHSVGAQCHDEVDSRPNELTENPTRLVIGHIATALDHDCAVRNVAQVTKALQECLAHGRYPARRGLGTR